MSSNNNNNNSSSSQRRLQRSSKGKPLSSSPTTSSASSKKSSTPSSSSSSASSTSKKSPVLIPPPLVQVDFGNGSRSASNGKAKDKSTKAITAKLPNGDPVNFNSSSKNKPRTSSGSNYSNNKNYSFQSLPDGKKPDFGNGNNKDIKNRATLKKKSKDETSSDLLNLLRENSPSTSSLNDSKSRNNQKTATTTSAKVGGAYAGNSFTYSAPSLISLPKPTF